MVPSISADIHMVGSLLPEIVMILFIQSTAVLHKYLNYVLNLLCMLEFNTQETFVCTLPRIAAIKTFKG